MSFFKQALSPFISRKPKQQRDVFNSEAVEVPQTFPYYPDSVVRYRRENSPITATFPQPPLQFQKDPQPSCYQTLSPVENIAIKSDSSDVQMSIYETNCPTAFPSRSHTPKLSTEAGIESLTSEISQRSLPQLCADEIGCGRSNYRPPLCPSPSLSASSIRILPPPWMIKSGDCRGIHLPGGATPILGRRRDCNIDRNSNRDSITSSQNTGSLYKYKETTSLFRALSLTPQMRRRKKQSSYSSTCDNSTFTTVQYNGSETTSPVSFRDKLSLKSRCSQIDQHIKDNVSLHTSSDTRCSNNRSDHRRCTSSRRFDKRCHNANYSNNLCISGPCNNSQCNNTLYSNKHCRNLPCSNTFCSYKHCNNCSSGSSGGVLEVRIGEAGFVRRRVGRRRVSCVRVSVHGASWHCLPLSTAGQYIWHLKVRTSHVSRSVHLVSQVSTSPICRSVHHPSAG